MLVELVILPICAAGGMRVSWGVLRCPRGVAERAEGPAFRNVTDALRPAALQGQWGDLPFSPLHLPLSRNLLNPLTMGLCYCQLCRARVAKLSLPSCLRQPATTRVSVPPKQDKQFGLAGTQVSP